MKQELKLSNKHTGCGCENICIVEYTELVTTEGKGQLRKAFETARSFLVNQRPAPAIMLGLLIDSLCTGQVMCTFKVPSKCPLLFASLISPCDVGRKHTVTLRCTIIQHQPLGQSNGKAKAHEAQLCNPPLPCSHMPWIFKHRRDTHLGSRRDLHLLCLHPGGTLVSLLLACVRVPLS